MNILQGAQFDKTIFRRQAEALHAIEPPVIFMGQFARTAAQATYEDVPALRLRKTIFRRDIDVISPRRMSDDQASMIHHSGPFPVDLRLQKFFVFVDGEPHVMLPVEGISIPHRISTDFFRPVERKLDGIPIRTLTLGALAAFQTWKFWLPAKRYEQKITQFSSFSARMKTNPCVPAWEFPDPRALTPRFEL